VLTGKEVFHGCENNRNTKACNENEDVYVLEDVEAEQWLQRVKPEEGVSRYVRVIVDIISVHVMLDYMLMNPIYG